MKRKTIKKIANAVYMAHIGQCLLVKSVLINELCIIFKMNNTNFNQKEFKQMCNKLF